MIQVNSITISEENGGPTEFKMDVTHRTHPGGPKLHVTKLDAHGDPADVRHYSLNGNRDNTSRMVLGFMLADADLPTVTHLSYLINSMLD